MGCPVSGGLWVWQPLYTLFILMNSEFGVFEHVIVKLLSFHAGRMRFAKHIVTIYSDAAKRKGASQHILIQLEINKFDHLTENCLKTFANKESWSEPWRYRNTCMIVGVIGTGLQSPRTNNSTHLRVEQVGGWPRTTLPWITISTMRFCWHWFMFEVLQATTIQSCLQWGRQCYLRCTRNIFRGKRTRSGCGRNQSGPRGTAMPSFGKPIKTNENHGKHGLPCRWWVWQPLWTMFELRNSQYNMLKHVLVKTTKLTMLVEWGLHRFARRTVT